MKTLVAVAVTAAGIASLPSIAAEERPQDRWNLADLYPSIEAWNLDAQRLDSEVASLAQCKGRLGESARRLRECLDAESDATKRLYRLNVYASIFADEDTGASAGRELRQRSQVLATRFGEADSFMSPEILGLGRSKVDAFLGEDKDLGVYRHSLDDILRKAPHTLDDKGEGIIAAFGLTSTSASSIYEVLANADMPWPTVTLSDGKKVKLENSAYFANIRSSNRDDRRKVFEAFWPVWKEFERTFGVTLYERAKQDTVQTKLRNYPDSLTRTLDGNALPRAVYDTLIAQVNANLPTLHRYFRLRAKLLGISGDMRYFDIYPPLVAADRKFDIDEAKRIMLEAVRPLGDEYVAAMAKGVESRWMDVYPRPRKLAGAYMAGVAYDVHPYLLMNYTGDYESVSTMVHEWGHAMHSYYSNRAQPFVNARYATFVAEIASTCNEALLLDHMLKAAKTDDERLLYLGSDLEKLRGTFFLQAMFSEFERQVHDRVDKGESLTGEKLTHLYADIVRRYNGEKEGVMKIDDDYTVAWASVPHFYRSFYVYQYATSIAASSLFAEAILQGKPGARERYLKLISSGGSDYPYELVKAAGVDLATPEPYNALVKRMNRIMDEIEAILARRK